MGRLKKIEKETKEIKKRATKDQITQREFEVFRVKTFKGIVKMGEPLGQY